VIPIVNDTLVEPTETINLTLGTPTGNATIGTQSTATLNIIDNDSSLQFSAPTFSVREDGTAVAAVRVTRTGSSAGAVSATVSATDGTATSPADYTNTPIVVNFANGDTAAKTVVIPIANDTLLEGTENINLTLGTPTGNATIGAQSTATLNVIDNDSLLQFSNPTFSVNEDGTPIAAVRVTRTGASTGAVSATVGLTDGTATSPADYTNTPIVVNFATGDVSPKTVIIPITNDTLLEGNETVGLTLGSPTGNAAIGAQSTATLNIVDNESALQFSNPTFSVSEDGTPIAAVRVTRTGSSAGAASATVNLADGTATSPADYTNTPVVVNFAAGDLTPKTVIIPLANDTLVEGTENVSLTLASPTGNGTIGTQSTATLNIVDNDSSLQFSNPTFTLNEDGTPVAAVRVTRTGSSAGAVSATVSATDGTATAPGDYTNSPVTVNFAAGDLTPKTVIIPIAEDTLAEGTENVSLTLASPTGNAAIGTQSTAILNIVDNDSTLQFSAPTFTVREDGTPIAAVRVTRTGASTGAVSATVSAIDGTAIAPGDYTNTPVVVNFAAGDTAVKTVIIPITEDLLVEGTENVSLTLGSPTGNASIGTQSTAILNIADNDTAPPPPIAPLSASAASSGSPESDATMRTQSSITANAADNDVAPSKPVVSVNSVLDPIAGEASTAEGNGLFQFARTGGDLSQPLTIRYTVTGTATAGEDYTALLGTVTIDAGKSVSAPVTISPTSDLLNEPTESVIVKVAENPAYQVSRLSSADTASVSILDDNPLKATASDSVLLYNSGGALVGGFSNITNAVAASNPNDIIVAKAGTYDEPGTIVINKPLTLRGPNGGISPSGTRLSEAVVRMGALGEPVFQIAPGVNNVTIEGLTIQMNGSNAIQQLGAGSGVVIRQNTLSGIGPNSGSVISLDSGIPGLGSVAVIDNLIESVSTSVGSNTNGIEASQFNTVRITDNQIANLTGSGIVADSITEFGLASVINSNKVSNVGQDGIRLQGGNLNIENNDITNANTSDVLTKGGIRLQDSSLPGGTTLGTVDVLSNFITNSVNGVAISNGISTSNVRVNDNNLVGNSHAGLLNDRSVTVNATENWWDSLTGPIVGGTGPNRIAGANANLVASNPFATSIL
ncbi:MAG: hypothetical protein HC789_11990, partial [Microcoleus sp. CSU_2_2]|nr:hypothetical protein [Microcoleus sp. CSU_2_2]